MSPSVREGGGEHFLAQHCRSQVKHLEERLGQSQSQVTPETSQNIGPEIQEKLQTVISQCQASEHQHREAFDRIQSVSNKVENLEDMRSQITELEQKISKINTQNIETSTTDKDNVPTCKLDSEDDIETLKCFVKEKVAGMKDLVSGPLSVVFDAIRSDDFVGEDNFLTFSKANQFIKLSETGQQGLLIF